MNCPECNLVMELLLFVKRGFVWICDGCGLTVKGGTAHLNYLTGTDTNG